MPTRAGQITIDVSAGTSKFVLDMESAKAKVREFGATTEASHKQAAAAVKALEGNLLNNTRAADAFLVSIKGLGPLIQAAFPVIGAVAFAGVLGELGKKVYDFFKELKEAPQKAAIAFYALSGSLHTTNDELELANAHLENDIAKLEGKRQNNLAIALAEAKVSADKLGESIEKDIESIEKLLKEQDVTFLQQLFGGGSGDDALQKYFKEAQVKLGELQLQQNEALSKTKDPTQAQAITKQFVSAQLKELEDARKQIEDALNKAKNPAANYHPEGSEGSTFSGFLKVNPNDVAKLQQDLIAIDSVINHLSLSQKNAELTIKKSADEVAKENEAITKPITETINALIQRVNAAKAANDAVGKGEAEQVAARATNTYNEAILKITNALGVYRDMLTAFQEAEIKSLATTAARTEEDTKYKTHFDDVTKSIQERITAQKDLAAAVGQSYDAQRKAFIATEVAKATKDFPDATPEQRTAIESGSGKLFDEQQNAQKAATLEKLSNQIQLEEKLASVQYQGAEAVRQVELAERIRVASIGKSADEVQLLTEKETALYNLQRLATENKSIDKFADEANATTKLGTAAFGGADSERQQKLLNEYAAMRKEGASDAEITAKSIADEDAWQAKLNEEAAETVNHFSNQLEHLQQMKDAIVSQYGANSQNIQAEIALRDIENQRLRILAEYTLKQGTASAGLKAFLLEAQADAKTAGQIIYDSLNSALDKVSDQFAKLLTGQKTSWAQMFKGLGEQIEKETIKASLQKGLGALGKHFGIDIPGITGKPDGSESKPFWVRMAGGQGGGSSVDLSKLFKTIQNGNQDGNQDDGSSVDLGGIFKTINGAANPNSGQGSSALGGLGGLFGSGAKGLSGIFSLFGGGGGDGSASALEDVTSSISFPGLADGGPVDPYSTYLVGENAPELFTPRSAGTITPLDKAGMGGQNHYYTIDARGAALGTENRISRAIDAAHSSAIQNSVRANHERSQRVPQKR